MVLAGRQCAPPIISQRDLIASFFQHGEGDFLVNCVILDQQHTGHGGTWGVCCGRWRGEGERQKRRWRAGAARRSNAVAQFRRPHWLGQAIFHAQAQHKADIGRRVERAQHDDF